MKPTMNWGPWETIDHELRIQRVGGMPGRYRIVQIAQVDGMCIVPSRPGRTERWVYACRLNDKKWELLSIHKRPSAARHACERDAQRATLAES